jgi:hypothetical protein
VKIFGNLLLLSSRVSYKKNDNDVPITGSNKNTQMIIESITLYIRFQKVMYNVSSEMEVFITYPTIIICGIYNNIKPVMSKIFSIIRFVIYIFISFQQINKPSLINASILNVFNVLFQK